MGIPSKVAPGTQFGRLRVLADTGLRKWGQIMWRCRCACGKETTVASASLCKRLTTSCGCYRTELIRERNRRTRHVLRREILRLAARHHLRVELPKGELTRQMRVGVTCPRCNERRQCDVAGLLRFPQACRHCSNRTSIDDLREQLRPRMIAVDRLEYNDSKHQQGRAYCKCQVCRHQFSRTVG